jgi:TctA family transporter
MYYYMASIRDTIAAFLAFILFALSGYLGFLSIQSTDLSAKTTFLYQATTLFILGSFLIAFWIVTWIVRRNMEKL